MLMYVIVVHVARRHMLSCVVVITRRCHRAMSSYIVFARRHALRRRLMSTSHFFVR